MCIAIVFWMSYCVFTFDILVPDSFRFELFILCFQMSKPNDSKSSSSSVQPSATASTNTATSQGQSAAAEVTSVTSQPAGKQSSRSFWIDGKEVTLEEVKAKAATIRNEHKASCASHGSGGNPIFSDVPLDRVQECGKARFKQFQLPCGNHELDPLPIKLVVEVRSVYKWVDTEPPERINAYTVAMFGDHFWCHSFAMSYRGRRYGLGTNTKSRQFVSDPSFSQVERAIRDNVNLENIIWNDRVLNDSDVLIEYTDVTPKTESEMTAN